MSDYFCSVCADRWMGTYNGDGRCVTCGNPVKAEPDEAEGKEEEEEDTP